MAEPQTELSFLGGAAKPLVYELAINFRGLKNVVLAIKRPFGA